MCNNWKVYDGQQAYKSYQIYIIYQIYNSYWLYNSYLVYNSYFVYDSSWVNNNVWMYDIYRLKTVIYCIIRYKNYNDCPTYFQCHKNQLPAIDWHYVNFAVQGSRVSSNSKIQSILSITEGWNEVTVFIVLFYFYIFSETPLERM